MVVVERERSIGEFARPLSTISSVGCLLASFRRRRRRFVQQGPDKEAKKRASTRKPKGKKDDSSSSGSQPASRISRSQPKAASVEKPQPTAIHSRHNDDEESIYSFFNFRILEPSRFETRSDHRIPDRSSSSVFDVDYTSGVVGVGASIRRSSSVTELEVDFAPSMNAAVLFK